MILRDYQIAAVEAVETEWEECASTLICMPTGTGKTQVFSEIVRRRLNRGDAIVIAHREELIFQAATRLQQITGVDPGIEMASMHAGDGLWAGEHIVVSTVQTQNSRGRMDQFPPKRFATLIIDEAHHAPAKTYQAVIDHYRQNPDLRVLGVTATPDRHDEKALGQVFETVAYDYELPAAIEDGWLVPIRQSMHLIDGLDYSEVRTVAGELNMGDVAKIVEQEGIVHEFAWPIIEEAGDRKTLVFCVTVLQAELLAAILNRHKPESAEWISGKTPKEDRRKIIKAYFEGKFQFLVNVGVATEGFDDPGIQCVAMARPTKSRALYAQMIGRATRVLPGVLDGIVDAIDRRSQIAESSKPFCQVIDFVGNTGTHKLITTADILGGKYDDDEVAEAEEILRKAKGAVDVADALEEAKRRARTREEEREAEKAKKRAEEERRRPAQPKAVYSSTNVDPFGLHDLHPVRERGWHRGRELSEKQKKVLEGRGVDPGEVTYTRGKQMIDAIFQRNLPTVKQINVLKKYSMYDGTETMADATAKINRIVAAGWKRPRDTVNVEVSDGGYPL